MVQDVLTKAPAKPLDTKLWILGIRVNSTAGSEFFPLPDQVSFPHVGSGF